MDSHILSTGSFSSLRIDGVCVFNFFINANRLDSLRFIQVHQVLENRIFHLKPLSQ